KSAGFAGSAQVAAAYQSSHTCDAYHHYGHAALSQSWSYRAAYRALAVQAGPDTCACEINFMAWRRIWYSRRTADRGNCNNLRASFARCAHGPYADSTI